MKTTRTTKYRYNEMMEVLPPEAMTHGRTRDGVTFSCFLVGEPTTYSKNGEAAYKSYFEYNDEYYTGELMTATELYDTANLPDALVKSLENADEPEEGSDDARILEAIKEHGTDIVEAYADCFGWDYVETDKISGAYTGQYDSDEDFARDMAEQCGDMKDDAQWPYTCIDWERAARDLMHDYTESNGYYFNNY